MIRNFLLILFILKQSSASLCEESKNYCSKCNPLTNLCIICSKENVLRPDEQGGCVGSEKCVAGQNYCLDCETDEKLCNKCDKGYYPDGNGGCSYTDNCLLSYKGECLECKEDFILIENNKICKSILNDDLKHCKEIYTKLGVCIECEEGYYLNKGDKKCSKIKNCYESMFGNCLSCIEGYYLNKKENVCKQKYGNFTFCKETIDGQNCDICNSGYYFDENGICVQSNYCSKSNNGKCEKCLKDFYLSSNNNYCVNTDNCYIGDKDTGLCLECNMYNYINLKEYKCKSNLKDNEHKYCERVFDNDCIKCEKGYYLGKDNKCTFTQNCEESENGKCISCLDNFYLGKDNHCSNVKHCIYSRFNFCRECEDGYYYSTIDKKCIKTEGNKKLENCKYTCVNPDETLCCECKNNYYLNSSSLCVDNNEEGSLYKCKYSDENNEKCLKCIDGYYLGKEDKKCTLIENCKKSKNETTCLECNDYYCLNSKRDKCIRNDFLKNEEDKMYFACKKVNEKGTKCEECIDRYELNENGYCFTLENCEATKDSSEIDSNEEKECIKCDNNQNKNGYFYCSNKYFGCIEGHFEHCIRCDNLLDLYECTECIKDYSKNQYGKCVLQD